MKKTILQSPIAIVGMSCRLPDADGLDEYWQLLVNGHDAIKEMPADRLDRQLYFDKKKGTRGRTYSTIGGLIKDRPLNRDICPFNDDTIQSADPCHLIFCEVAATACVHAGWDLGQIRNSNTGVFVGHSAGSPRGGELAFGTLAEQVADYLNDLEDFNDLSEADRHDVMRSMTQKLRERRPSRSVNNNLNVGASEAAHLVSRTLGLTGPSMVVDAACASSLVALSMGIMALQAGEIDSAIIGGASLNKADSLILFSHAQSCTAVGTRPFDDRADGLANSEGYVALVIKLLEDAVADGDEIHGVIRGIGISSDGRGRSLWAPRKEGQVEAISRAYRDNLDASRVQYVEAHATSTRVGDATELESLGEFFRPFANGRKLPIGSVKSNIGHTLETAGLAGLLKTLLAMKHGVIPPTANLQKPSEAVDWNHLPFHVPTKAIPWRRPQENLPRRAAVNAFGIGGLNCHVVVDQSPEPGLVDHSRVIRRPESAGSDNRIAIIGRGVVLPDAHDRESFGQLLATGRSAIKQAPEHRWRNRIGVHPDRGLPWHSPTGRGGFIVGYEYDWKRFKIPPKQIAQANPLQFMLLDAAEQALAEAGLEVEGAAAGRKPFDRVETAVVVGGSFAGDFGNQLQIGLRLPEMRRDLQRLLGDKGMGATQIARLLDQFETNILKQYPALIDETGSFTSSTLASRLTKTLNLMGGAMAIDATDASSYSAISVASNLLKTGACSQVLCCAAQRSMDLAGYEWLASQRRLQGTNAASPGDGHLPGEGVAVVLLKRHADAVRDGDRIFGVFDSIGAYFDENDPGQAAQEAIARAMESSRSELQFAQQYADCGIREIDSQVAEKLGLAYEGQHPSSETTLHDKVGHLQSAHGLASIVAATLQHESATTLPATFTSRIRNGMTYHLALDKPLERRSQRSQKTPTVVADSEEFANVIRIGATSLDELRRKVTIGDPHDLFLTGRSELLAGDVFRISLVSHNAAEVASQLKLAAAMMDREGAAPALQQKGIYVGRPDIASRIAFLFPGQGSQYPDMMRDVIAASTAARRCVDQANQYLAEMGRESFQQFTREPAGLLHSDLETTQLAVLVGNMIMFEAMREQGVSAACVSGHSFGEVAALVASEAITFRDAIYLTRARTESILSHPSSGGLLSLVSSAANVQQLIDELNADVVLTHYNAPEQTVVGGTLAAIDQVALVAEARGMRPRKLNVPGALHTQLMQAAQQPFRQALNQFEFRSPRLPMLSNANNRYASTPAEFRENLVSQLTSPVRYIELIQQLVRDGYRTLVEVGPSRVLTSLNRRIVDEIGSQSSFLVIATDEPNRSHLEQMAHVQAALESRKCGDTQMNSRNTALQTTPNHPLRVVQNNVDQTATPSMIEFFDATMARRNRVRNARTNPDLAPVASQHAASAVSQFDATQSRKTARRSAAAPTTQIAASSSYASHGNGQTYSGNGNSNDSVGSTSAQTAPVIQPPVTAPATSPTNTSASVSTGTSSNAGRASLEQFLVDFIVDQTGYPPEIIEVDWDLEADLGIDSIKRAQLFGELREVVDLDSAASEGEELKLDQFNTIRQIVDFLETLPGKHTWMSDTPHSGSDKETSTDEVAVAEAQTAATRPANGPDAAVVEQFLVDFVVDQTGYPPEIVELDADFEADLGIDSIKKAQLIGELSEQFGLTEDSAGSSGLGDLRTLRDVVNLINTAVPDSSASPATVATVAVAPQHDSSSGLGRQTTSLASNIMPEATTRRMESAESSIVQPSAQPIQKSYSEQPSDYDQGYKLGQQSARDIKARLISAANPNSGLPAVDDLQRLRATLTAPQLERLRGVADGARLNFTNVVVGHLTSLSQGDPVGFLGWPADSTPVSTTTPASHASRLPHVVSALDDITSRYTLSTVPAERSPGSPTTPEFHGAAIILGINSVGRAFEERLRNEGVTTYVLEAFADPKLAVAELERIWAIQPVLHLFIVTPRDEAAKTDFDTRRWQQRRQRGIMTPFWLCQRFLKLVEEHKAMDRASIVATTSLGGDFGFSKAVGSAESGALAGLLKAIIIESWVNGHRTIPVKIIDSPILESSESIVEGAFRELAVRSYDCEIGWCNGRRHVVRAKKEPIKPADRKPLTKNAVWVCTGGARGITAHVARALAERTSAKLHLIGVSPLPEIPDSWRIETEEQRRELKISVMQQARLQGKSPVKEWENTEKLIEIDQSIREFSQAGISATYHSCDVSNVDALADVLNRIRQSDGPIQGILHGAGVGKDSRFQHKKPDNVEKCLRAKIDGTLALMELTQDDPIEHFVAFGSISGRFGANGHADYSLANDAMAKLIDWYRQQRPDVNSVAFHWHAWGDVGMATKPETKLALEMVNMQFMPAAEGLEHLFGELEIGAPDGEVLITDDRYYRLFYPSETLDGADQDRESPSRNFPLLSDPPVSTNGKIVEQLRLDPTGEVFLIQHRLEDRPLLPIVIGMELLSEAALRHHPEKRVAALHNLVAHNGLRFFNDNPQDVRVQSQSLDTNRIQTDLTADFCARDGRLVESDRRYLSADVELGDASDMGFHIPFQRPPADAEWQPVQYAPEGSKFYLGPALQGTREIFIEGNIAWAKIAAPALVELCGAHRTVADWVVPSAVIDASLYATGLLGWSRVRAGASLPAEIGELRLGRLPIPGEQCLLKTELVRSDHAAAWFNFRLWGSDGQLIVEVKDYRIVWLVAAK